MDEEQREELLTLMAHYGIETLVVDDIEARLKPIKEAVARAIDAAKEAMDYDGAKESQAEAKAMVIEFALMHLPPKRTSVEHFGYVDVTPQPDEPVVINLLELLADPTAHRFIQAVQLTPEATEYLNSGKALPGVMTRPVEPKVRISVKDYLDRQDEMPF